MKNANENHFAFTGAAIQYGKLISIRGVSHEERDKAHDAVFKAIDELLAEGDDALAFFRGQLKHTN